MRRADDVVMFVDDLHGAHLTKFFPERKVFRQLAVRKSSPCLLSVVDRLGHRRSVVVLLCMSGRIDDFFALHGRDLDTISFYLWRVQGFT